MKRSAKGRQRFTEGARWRKPVLIWSGVALQSSLNYQIQRRLKLADGVAHAELETEHAEFGIHARNLEHRHEERLTNAQLLRWPFESCNRLGLLIGGQVLQHTLQRSHRVARAQHLLVQGEQPPYQRCGRGLA